MAILYVASEAAELKPFAALLTGLRKLKWPIDYAFEGIWEGRRVMLAANGAGPRLAAQAVEIAIRAFMAAELSSSKLDVVVSTGWCGAIDPSLREGQIVVGTQVLDVASQESFDCIAVNATADHVLGVVLSQDRIIMSAADKKHLTSGGGIAVDMEAAGVGARAKRAGLPFCCIKVVSDRADESFGLDLNELRTTEGRIARGKIVSYAVTHPQVFPELLRLRRRTRDAAVALGDFLVSCRINSEADATRIE